MNNKISFRRCTINYESFCFQTRKNSKTAFASFEQLASTIRYKLQERVALIVCVYVHVSVCACDPSGQVTGIRVIGAGDWLQGDQTNTHTGYMTLGASGALILEYTVVTTCTMLVCRKTNYTNTALRVLIEMEM